MHLTPQNTLAAFTLIAIDIDKFSHSSAINHNQRFVCIYEPADDSYKRQKGAFFHFKIAAFENFFSASLNFPLPVLIGCPKIKKDANRSHRLPDDKLDQMPSFYCRLKSATDKHSAQIAS